MTKGFTISNMQVEYQERPLGLDISRPRISWEMKSECRGERQIAYQITVGTKRKGSDIWDSKKVLDDSSCEILWDGDTLGPCTRYYAEVCVWNQNGETAFADTEFETGYSFS